MSDQDVRRIACQLEGETLVVNLYDDMVLYLTDDEAHRLLFQAGEAVFDTFDIDANKNIVPRNMDGVEIEKDGITLSHAEWTHLFHGLEECLATPDGQVLDESEPDSDENVGEDVEIDRVNWMKEGF